MSPPIGKIYRVARKFASNPGLILPRKRPLQQTPEIAGERFVFIAGLHRSGTSILHRLLRAHPDTSGFSNTRVPEDEGQYLQTVYPLESASGGPGLFAFDPEAHLTEDSPLATEENRDKLLREWAPYFDLSRPILLEKTPINLIRTRFFQALLPGCRFVFIVRHPIVAGQSTHAWTRRSGISLANVMKHWAKAHQIFLDDLPHLRNWSMIRYEDMISDPSSTMAGLYEFLKIAPVEENEVVRDRNQHYFSSWESEVADKDKIVAELEKSVGADFFARFGYQFRPPYVVEPAKQEASEEPQSAA